MYSFSQNFEDVYIRRAFSEISDGFYIDIGAFDPVADSITKMLYDMGWSGINVEPGPNFSSFAERTRDINLSFAIGTSQGEVDFFYNAGDPGTSSIIPRAGNETAETDKNLMRYCVPMATLDWIIENFAKDRHIHFLKIDIEGGEWDVIRHTAWDRHRPELLIVESTLPYSNTRRDAEWVRHLDGYNYREVFFDGVNTYFLRVESLFRQEAFSRPINVLDGVRKFDPILHGGTMSATMEDDRRLKSAANAIALATADLRQEATAARNAIGEYVAHREAEAGYAGHGVIDAEIHVRLGVLHQQLQAQKEQADDLRRIDAGRLAALRDLADAIALGAGAFGPTTSSRSNSGETLLADLAAQIQSWIDAQSAAAERGNIERDKAATDQVDRLTALSRALAERFSGITAAAEGGALDAESLMARLLADVEVAGNAWNTAQVRIADLAGRAAEADRHRRDAQVLSNRLHNARRSRDRVTGLARSLQAKLDGEQTTGGLLLAGSGGRDDLERRLHEQVLEQGQIRKDLDTARVDSWLLRRDADEARREAEAAGAAALEHERSIAELRERLAEAGRLLMTQNPDSRSRATTIGTRLMRFLRRSGDPVVRADRLRDAGRCIEAAEAYAVAFAALPDRIDLCVQQANMLKDAGKLDHAETCYRIAISARPDDADAYLQLGHLHRLAGRRHLAEAAYRQAGEIGADRSDVDRAIEALAEMDR